MWIILVLIILVTFVNYFLGAKLYMLPKDERYFENVKRYNTVKLKDIMVDPGYILKLTILLGTLYGLFITFANLVEFNIWVTFVFLLYLGMLYIIEITRKVSISEESLNLSKAFARDITINLDKIKGMYIYSFNERLIETHAFTTKLVICTDNKKYKFTISSLSIKAILNMMKDNFDIEHHRIFIVNPKKKIEDKA